MTFRWRADDGPILVVFGGEKSWTSSENNFLDPRMSSLGGIFCSYLNFDSVSKQWRPCSYASEF